jgi:hypothetical protein
MQTKVNKFLKLYPKLLTLRPGDKVKIVRVLNSNKKEAKYWPYEKGDIGVIKHIYNDWYEIIFNDHIFVVFDEEIEPYHEQ